MDNQLAFGLRSLRACFVGIVLCSVWVFVWQPTLQPIGFFEIREDFNLFGALLWPLKRSIIRDPAYTLAVMLAWPVFFLGTMRFIRLLVSVFAKQFGAFGDGLYLPIWFTTKWLARGVVLVFWVAGGWMLYHSEAMQNQYSEAIWIGIFDYLLPTILLWGLVFLTFARDRSSEFPLYVRFFLAGRGGSGRFGSVRTVKKNLSKWRSKSGGPFAVKGDDIYMGRSTFGDSLVPRHIGIKDDAHLMTVACAGAGKSTTSIWPNLKVYSGGVFCLDPKSEHYTQCYGSRGEGARLDPFNEAKKEGGKSYNPLCEIDIKNDSSARIMLTAISDGCILKDNGANQHFTDMAKLVFEGWIIHNLSKESPENQNLPFIYDCLVGVNENGFADPDLLETALIDMRMNGACGGIVQLAASTLDGMGSRERGSVMSTLARSLKWIGDPAMRNQLQSSDVRMADLANGKLKTVWCILPTRAMDEYARWMRVMINVSIRVIESQSKRPKVPVLFLLDEFPKLHGSLDAIESGIVTLRAAGIKIWPFIQNISQLQRDYPNNWQSFISSSTVQCYGVNDMATAEFISKLLGEKMRARKEKDRIVQEMPRPVLTPNEVMVELAKNSPMEIVFPQKGLPMRLTRRAFKPITVEGQRFGGSPSAWQMVVNE